MKIRVRHTYDFGPERVAVGSTLLAPSAWDAARSLPGPFELANARVEWERNAERGDLRERARDVAAVAKALWRSESLLARSRHRIARAEPPPDLRPGCASRARTTRR